MKVKDNNHKKKEENKIVNVIFFEEFSWCKK